MKSKSNNRFNVFCFLLAFSHIIAGRVPADPEEQAGETVRLSPPERWIVARNNALVMTGDDKTGSVPLGTVLEATRSRGPWRYSRAVPGWVHTQDLVPVEEAVERFAQRIKKDPTPTAYHLRGIAYIAVEDWRAALRDFKSAFDLGDSSVSLHYNLALCYRQLGDYDNALGELTSVLESYPDEFPSYLARAGLFQEQGQWRASLKDYDAALRLRPDSPDAHNQRGVVLRMLGRFEDAETAYSRALEQDPRFAVALANRGYARKSLGRFQAALEDYERALRLEPEAHAFQNDLAWLLATCPDPSVRDPQRSVELASAATRAVEDQDGDYLDTLAAAYASQGDYDRAVQLATQALELLSESPDAAAVQERLEMYRNGTAFIENK